MNILIAGGNRLEISEVLTLSWISALSIALSGGSFLPSKGDGGGEVQLLGLREIEELYTIHCFVLTESKLVK
jgi:hypothetical protein